MELFIKKLSKTGKATSTESAAQFHSLRVHRQILKWEMMTKLISH